MKNRHSFNKKRNARRLQMTIEQNERELLKTRQLWTEWEKSMVTWGDVYRMERG